MPDTADTAKPVPGAADRAMQIRHKAKIAAKTAGKEWASLSKEDRQSFMETVREDLKDTVEEKRAARIKRD